MPCIACLASIMAFDFGKIEVEQLYNPNHIDMLNPLWYFPNLMICAKVEW